MTGREIEEDRTSQKIIDPRPEMSADEIVKVQRLSPNQAPDRNPPVCTSCRVKLVRADKGPMTFNDELIWTHPTSTPYDPMVEIADADYRQESPVKLHDLFKHYHRQLDEKRLPPGEVQPRIGTSPAITVPHDPDYRYEEEK